MNQSQFLTKHFPHKPPKGYSYEIDEFKRDVISIWICNHSHFDYSGRSNIRSIWGFFNTKTNEYHSPINSKTVGKRVTINETTPYSAMVLKRTPLESAFV